MDSLQRHDGMDGADYAMTAPAVSRKTASAPAFDFDVVRSVKLHPRIAGLVAIVVFVVVALYALTRKPTYQAESLTYIEPLTTKVVSDGSGGVYDPARYDSYIQQQIQTAGREDILEDAISKLPEGTWRLPNESLADAANRLSGAIKVTRVASSYQLSISMMDANPERTAAIVNAVTKSYLEKGRKDENARSDGRLQLLHEESDRIQAELAQDRAEQATLSKTLGVANAAGDTANPYDEQLAGIRTELTAAREAHEVAEAQLASVSKTNSANDAAMKAVADDAIAGDAGLVAFKSSINQRRATLSSQMAGLTSANPLYKQDQDELASLDRELEAKTSQLRQSTEQRVEEKLRLDLRRTGDVEARLNAELAHEVSMAGGAAPKLQRASELAADITRLEARYATVDDALRGIEIESNGPGTAHLSVAATVPTAPEASRQGLLLALSIPLALLAGGAAAVIARKRDKRVYAGRDVEDELGVAPLCVVPATHEISDRARNEYMLRLAAAVERGYRLNGARNFLLTAASETTEIETFAHEICEQLRGLGFKAVVAHASEILFVREETGSEPAISRYRRSEGVAAAKLETLKKNHDLILIAAEPLLHSAATEYAASAADASFVIIESGVTTRVELRQAMLLLRKLKVRGVGTIIMNHSAKFEKADRPRTVEVLEQRLATAVQLRPARPSQEPAQSAAVLADSDQRHVIENEKGIVDPAEKRFDAEPEPVTVVAEPIEARGAIEEIRLFDEATVPTPATPATPAFVFKEQSIEMPEKIQIEEPANVIAPEIESSPADIRPTESAPVDTEAERLKKAVIARVRAKFTASPVSQPSVEQIVRIEEPALESPAAEENVDVVRNVVDDQAATKMLTWGTSIKHRGSEETEAPISGVETSASPRGDAVDSANQKRISEAIAQALLKSEALVSTRQQLAKGEATEGLLKDGPPLRRKTDTRRSEDIQVRERRQEPKLETKETASETVPAIAPSHRPERRRVPRVAAFPQGLSKAISSMDAHAERRSAAIAAGPRLTAAEQAIVHMSESRRERSAPPTVKTQSTASPRRWVLLSQFDSPLDGPGDRPEQDRAAV